MRTSRAARAQRSRFTPPRKMAITRCGCATRFWKAIKAASGLLFRSIMKLGFVSAILPDLSLGQVLAFASEEGFGCVELMCWPVGKAERKFAGVTHVDVSNLTRDRIDEIHGHAAHHNVEISGLGYYPNPLDPNPEISRKAVDHLKKVILAAEKFELDRVNTFVGRDWTLSVDKNWPRFLKIWKPLIRFAEDHGVR